MQLRERERLDQIVVGSPVETLHAIADGLAGGEYSTGAHTHRSRGRRHVSNPEMPGSITSSTMAS